MTYEWSLIQNAKATAKREARTEHGAIWKPWVSERHFDMGI